jgi:hypothetical protein
MRRTLASLLILMPFVAVGQVYKWTDADGKVQYSDRPVTGAETLAVPLKKVQRARGEAANPSAATQASPGPYDQFSIVSPDPGATLRQTEGNVQVSLVLNPALMEGHHIQLVVDGSPAAGEAPGTQVVINGLPFGSHQLEARILDAAGAQVANSSSISFHLLKPEEPPAAVTEASPSPR